MLHNYDQKVGMVGKLLPKGATIQHAVSLGLTGLCFSLVIYKLKNPWLLWIKTYFIIWWAVVINGEYFILNKKKLFW